MMTNNSDFRRIGSEGIWCISLRLQLPSEKANRDGVGAPEGGSWEQHQWSLETGAKIIFHIVVGFARQHLPCISGRFNGLGGATRPFCFLSPERLSKTVAIPPTVGLQIINGNAGQSRIRTFRAAALEFLPAHCRIAKNPFRNQPGVIADSWCEKGHFRE